MVKWAFIRSKAKWPQPSERNSSYFLAFEKQNQRRNNLSAFKIDNNIINNHLDILKHVVSLMTMIYTSKIVISMTVIDVLSQ